MTLPVKRKPLTPLQRAKLFDEHGGICGLCGIKIKAGELWRDEHMRALGLLGTNDWDNRAPVHVACARQKDKEDLPRIAKAKRVYAKHIGAHRSRNPVPGSKGSKFRKKMNGTVEIREPDHDT